MSNAWESAKSLAEKHANQGGIFIRLAADGDKIVGAFCSEPFAREVIWLENRYELFDADNPAHVGKRASLRVMLNFFVPAEDAMKVVEGGTMWFKDVLKVRDKYGLDKWLFEIERHGDAGDPKTTYSILPEEKIDDAMRARMAAAEPHDLATIGNGDSNEGDAKKPRAERKPAKGPIDPRAAGELVALLKALPRGDVDAFLEEFGIQRVRELPAAQEAAARSFIEAQTAALAPATTDIDPFA